MNARPPDTGPPRCPICHDVTERASLHAPYAYWRCRACDTVHLHPQPSSEFLDAFYEQYHRPAEEGGIFADFEGRTAADFPAKARIVAAQLGWKPGMDQDGPRVLDVGCGKGYFVRELSRLGLRAEGIDLSQTGIADGTRQGIQGLHAGRLEERMDWAGRFDAVTAWATIEHLPNPENFLAALRRVVKPGGLLFLDTGLAGDFVDRWAPGLTQWYDVPQHLFVHSRRGMEALLRKTGFSVEQFDAHFERNAVRRLVKFVRNRCMALVGSCLFRTALGSSVYERMRMESKMPFGSLMFVVARLDTRL